MIRQARTYLVGAVSATSLIAAAIVVFVALVSLQALRDWPLTGLAEGDSGATAVSAAQPVKSRAAIGLGVGEAAAPDVTIKAGHKSGSDSQSATGAISPASGSPVASVPQAGSPGAAPHAASGGGSQPSPSGSPGTPASSSGGSPGGGTTKPTGDGGETGSPEGGSSPSETVTGTVNETVHTVDEATGGALGESGLTETVEGVVEKVAGPESTVGETVDKTVEGAGETVGGLLGSGR